MGLDATRIAGVYLSRLEPIHDDRGSFTRVFDATEFTAVGLDPVVSQVSASNTISRATLRGMHVQASPFGETKHIRCAHGAVFDVTVDVRPESATFGEWLGFELNHDDNLTLVVAPGIAHGFMTLTANAEVVYQISVPYTRVASVGFAWNDPDVGIRWPLEPILISDRDRNLPPLSALVTRYEEWE